MLTCQTYIDIYWDIEFGHSIYPIFIPELIGTGVLTPFFQNLDDLRAFFLEQQKFAPWPDRADANLAKEQLTSLMQFAQDLSELTNWDEHPKTQKIS